MNSIEKSFETVKQILANLPTGWVELTTHRLDIYDESQAKSQFLEQLAELLENGNFSEQTLENLPTAYDYIRLGHQLSSVLEWLVGQINQVASEQVISFDSKTMPILAMVRKNTLNGQPTYIYYDTEQLPLTDVERLQNIYGYKCQMVKLEDIQKVPHHDDGTVLVVTQSAFEKVLSNNGNIDATVNLHPDFGCIMVLHRDENGEIAKEVQHVRRRETIAMTPINCLHVLQQMVNGEHISPESVSDDTVELVHQCIKDNTGSKIEPLVASSGLSIQYAMMMGLVEYGLTQYAGKPIQIIIPPNCYGGTNDQARRIANLIGDVSIVDLPVDGGNDMVSSLDRLLDEAAKADAVPLVLAEIPTNPRVEVPDMQALGDVFKAARQTEQGTAAIAPVFMVDQTFCPNVKLLGDDSTLAGVKVISYSSGSKFPSGGRCIAGYCAANDAAKDLQVLIKHHLVLSENAATRNQMNTLAENMPSMPQRIKKAYENTKVLVAEIQALLPQMKMNFVSDELAQQHFTPSVFSMDLPAVGDTPQAREAHKRELNQKLIDHMLANHPGDCKYCVSYGQLKGTYWTIPATSTQGTTKESDKDYIVRVALSPVSDPQALAKSFTAFCRNENLV